MDRRVIGALIVLVVLVAAAAVIPHPTIAQIREWAVAVGPAFPLLFLLVHAVVTVAPFPRTIFTLSAGVLFGATTGIVVTVVATTVSAVVALLLVRAVGREVVTARLTHPAIRSVDRRLARRGWLAVGSLRLLAPIPFAVVNYCCGVSAVRVVPYTLATVVGILPGTIGVVVLGDALTGRTNPALALLSALCIAIGVVGLVIDARIPVRGTILPPPKDDPDEGSEVDDVTSRSMT